jgi:hypothetical protein
MSPPPHIYAELEGDCATWGRPFQVRLLVGRDDADGYSVRSRRKGNHRAPKRESHILIRADFVVLADIVARLPVFRSVGFAINDHIHATCRRLLVPVRGKATDNQIATGGDGDRLRHREREGRVSYPFDIAEWESGIEPSLCVPRPAISKNTHK